MKNSLSPPAQSLFGHLPAFRKDPLGFLTHCARGYGNVVPLRLLHIPAFLLLDPCDIERVLTAGAEDFIKPAWLRTPAVRRLLGDGLVSSEGDSWRRQRRACQPAFQPRRMEDYGQGISAVAERALKDWQPGQMRNLQRDMMHLTLEIVACILLDVDSPGWTVEAGAALDTLMARFGAGPSLFGMVPLPPGLEELRAARQLDSIVDFLIRQHGLSLDGSRNDLLALIQNSLAGGKSDTSGHSVREQVKTFLGAGYESSALALTWAFLLMAQHPEAQARLAAELNTALHGRPPMPADLPQLPYARAVVQETLRLYPPLWMTGRQSVNACEIGGARVPAGALVMTSQWAVQRHPRYFLNPDDFRPERWLSEETTNLPRYAYFPFGGGPRICIAHRFAMMETVLLLAAIARRFRLEIAPGAEVRPWATMTLRPAGRVDVRLREQRQD